MIADGLKLDVYFGEGLTCDGRPASDVLMDCFEQHGVRAAALYRGIEGFGIGARVRTERFPDISSDLPLIAEAIDARETIDGLLADVDTIVGQGLVTLEHSRLAVGDDVRRASVPAGVGEAARLTVYCDRGERSGRRPSHRAVVDLMHRLGMGGATMLLGVDGLHHGRRRRAGLLRRNADVPVAIIAVGPPDVVERVTDSLPEVLAQPIANLERIAIVKHDGRRLEPLPAVADVDGADPPPVWVAVRVYTRQSAQVHGGALYTALTRRLRDAGASGVTTVRGEWGFSGDEVPFGDRFATLRSHRAHVHRLRRAPSRPHGDLAGGGRDHGPPRRGHGGARAGLPRAGRGRRARAPDGAGPGAPDSAGGRDGPGAKVSAELPMEIVALQTTPLKGAMIERRDRIEIGPNGVETNRRFFLIDARGLMFNGKRDGRLARLRAGFDPESGRLSIELPGGATVAGVPTPVGEPITTSFYGRPVAGHAVDGPFADALSEYAGQPVRLLASDRPGDAIDVHPVTIVSSASIAALAQRMPGDEIDRRRFRMLVEVDGVEPLAEDGWIGQKVRLGDAVVQIEGPVPRCVVTTHNPDTGVRDADTLRAILAYRGARPESDLDTPVAHLPDNGKAVFGVYASVVTPGGIGVGDEAVVQAAARAA